MLHKWHARLKEEREARRKKKRAGTRAVRRKVRTSNSREAEHTQLLPSSKRSRKGGGRNLHWVSSRENKQPFGVRKKKKDKSEPSIKSINTLLVGKAHTENHSFDTGVRRGSRGPVDFLCPLF